RRSREEEASPGSALNIMTTATWYHRDITRVRAEELLACAGRDGSFLVRDSESVPGAYALCLFQRHVHTYRILPDADGLLAVQVSRQRSLLIICTVTSMKENAGENYACLFLCSLVICKCLHLFMCMCLHVKIKVVRYGRQTVSVDIDAGVLLFDKRTGSFGVETVTHDRIVQLVKIQRGPAKLKMVIDILMLLPQKREAFCRLLQLMKTAHCQQSELDVISVFVGTWNMGGTPPPGSLQSWVTCCGLGLTPDESIATLPHDIYAVGTQDNPQGEREWAEHIRATLRSATNIDFKQVAVQSLWNIRLAVFVKPEHEGRISQVNTASVKTGLGNTLGNKGAVGVSLLFNGTSMGFVNCHLTSGSDKALRRNHNFQDILRLLSLGEKQLGTFDISLRFNHLFWCGDLNYRLDLDALDILKHVSKREFDELMCADQLTRERHRRKAFFNFKEEKILFPPTYRYERGSRDCYLWQKYKSSGVQVNGPSWCDRVLWKSYSESHIICTSYGCTDDIFTSDHSPVFATFEVGVISQSPRTELGSERASIELEAIEVIVKTASKAKFFIEFHSRCLEEPRRSAENDSQCCEVPGFLKLGWSSKQFPKLHPVFSDLEHLRDQHLLLSVKSCDGFESYGECCVALHSVTGKSSDLFETCLTHRGEEMGSIRGRIRAYVPPDRRRIRERVYGGLIVFALSMVKYFYLHTCSDDRVLLPFSIGHYFDYTSCSLSRAPSSSYVAAPNSYTNPAYFIFEGVPVLRRVEEIPSSGKESQVVYAKDAVIQLPRVTGGHSHGKRSARRSDFTEIEIPGSLAPYKSSCETQSELTSTASSYQLFPGPDVPNTSPNQRHTTSSNTSLLLQSHKNNTTQDSVLSVKKVTNSYMNSSVFSGDIQAPLKEKVRKDYQRLHQDRPPSMRNGPELYPYISTRVPVCEVSVPWIVEQPTTASGDNSLTALQIAKSLSEVDFQPVDRKYQFNQMSSQQRHHGYNYGLASERNYSWEKEVS
uniref:phosphatidylinositol-3,4,5-trisphosphate 5-phosphatase n=1 Tax=Sinocyclocheilus grahami TaxID=75366 RepID=A0A672T7U0_SINGR